MLFLAKLLKFILLLYVTEREKETRSFEGKFYLGRIFSYLGRDLLVLYSHNRVNQILFNKLVIIHF